ncbi:MAG: choice-of-anchor P family protein [Acidimicrobiia bacterium]
MRTARRFLVLAALSSLAVVAAPAARAQTPTVASVIGSADGLFVDLDINVDDSPGLTFGPEPSVTLPPQGGSVSDQVASVSETVAFVSLTADLLRVSAEGALGPDGFATAESTVADIELQELDSLFIGGIVGAEAITATCSADLSGVSGSTTLVGASVLDTALDVEPEPNTEFAIAIDGAEVSGILNRQVENPDGSLSVTALVLEIVIGDDIITGTLEIGPATCGVVEGIELPAEEVVPAPAQAVPAQARFTG